MKRLPLLFLALAAMFTGCSKDSETVKPTDNAGLLKAKQWTITSFIVKEGNDPEENVYSSLDACFKDNVYKFQTNSKFVYEEGATRCDSGDPQTLEGNWVLTNGDKNLTYTAYNLASGEADVVSNGTIEELTADKLVVSETQTEDGVTTKLRITYAGK